MTIEQTIQKAIEGGWKKLPAHTEFRSVRVTNEEIFLTFDDLLVMESAVFTYSLGMSLLDPKFWEALGKSLGWKESSYQECTAKSFDYDGNRRNLEAVFREPNTWLYHWHRFIDHLASGDFPESYFESL
jgi:hypothetical protein